MGNPGTEVVRWDDEQLVEIINDKKRRNGGRKSRYAYKPSNGMFEIKKEKYTALMDIRDDLGTLTTLLPC